MVIFKFRLRVSWRQLEFLITPRRIGFPAATGGTMPIELPRFEPAILAMVARQALRMAGYEIAHEFQIVAPFGGGDPGGGFWGAFPAGARLGAGPICLFPPVSGLRALRVQ